MQWKSNVSNLIREVELRKPPVIITVNKFDEDSATKFCQEMAIAQNTGQTIVPVVISSYGGQVYSLMKMINAIEESNIPVATIVEGKAMSCGAVLFTCGTKGMRYMSKHSTLMIHDVSSGGWGKNSEIQSNAYETKRLNKKIYEIMAKNTGLTTDWFHEQILKIGRGDWFLTEDECYKLGLCDHIGTPEMNVSINVEYDFKLPKSK